jgi:proteasome lid subunit RPN8/RPN11
MLSADVIHAAQAHARAEYPRESCGLVVDGTYRPMANLAEDPTKNFRIAPAAWMMNKIEAVLHSHPNGPFYPSKTDMEGQLQSQVPWGIIALDDERVGEALMWGDSLPIKPILGREFMHGITDCYSTLRDVFRLGREKLLEQDIAGWPLDPIVLPEVPRDDCWWDGADDLYAAHFSQFGFRPISVDQARGGDVFLMKMRSQKFNHAGVLTDEGLIIHHLVNRLSRREPAGVWGRAAGLWIRHEASNA